MKAILVATDGSEPAAHALDVAVDLARQTGAALHVLSVHVMRPVGRAGGGPAVREVEEVHGAEHIAEAAAQRAREAGIEATPHAIQGDVVVGISDAAKTLGADMVVVGSRGMGTLSGAVLGSVSHALVRRCPVPVTIVRNTPAKATATV